jgi:putative CocE/NonD family hydrolase
VANAHEAAGVVVENDVMVTMRDGVRLACDIYRPASDEPVPALVQRQPYDKRVAQTYVYDHPAVYARHGYAVVIEDTRGRYASEGEFYPLRLDAEDGYDTIEWSAAQPWCNGKVGSFGFSIPGINQLLTAALKPPHLVAAVPGFYPGGMYEGFTHVGGTFGLAAVMDWAILIAGEAARRRGDAEVLNDIGAAASACGKWPAAVGIRQLPLLETPDVLPFLKDYVDHPSHGEYWEEFDLAPRLLNIDIPCFHVSGWYDSFIPQTIQAYEALSAAGSTEHRLLVGPWYHIPWTQQVGAIDFGDDAKNVVSAYERAWFDAWLKGDRTALDALPAVRVFVTGENRWHDSDRWPLAGAGTERWYLHSGGVANSLSGDGALSRDAPGDEPPDFFIYNPFDPIASMGGHSCCLPQNAPMGPVDQRPVEYRNDVLVYSSAPLDAPVFAAGFVKATLSAATSARDTDFTVKLCDVEPDGRSINLFEGVIRGRYRESRKAEVFLEPNEIYEFAIDVGVICHLFRAGHRIRVEVSSSNFPAFDRNPNTGQPIGTEHTFDLTPAHQTIFHDGAHASFIDLPVVRQ